jgi:hypothetical protein
VIVRHNGRNSGPVSELAGIYKHDMKSHLSDDLEPVPPRITRALEDGTDYQPDWRHLQMQQYLKEIHQADPESPTRLDEILKQEPDSFVRDLLLFYCGRRPGNYEAIEYAVRCWQNNCNTRSASRIKAMVVANATPKRIAYEFGTTEDKIGTFERLYFDARRYLKNRGWLASICYPAAKPEDAASAAESRWFPVAFRRGWPGIEEIVLGHMPKSGQRTVQDAASILLGRVEDYCVGLEASGTALSEKDVKMLSAVARIGLPYLWENPLEQEPSTDSPAIQAFKKLPPASRDKVLAFLTKVMDAAAKKALANESQGQEIEPNKPAKVA